MCLVPSLIKGSLALTASNKPCKLYSCQYSFELDGRAERGHIDLEAQYNCTQLIPFAILIKLLGCHVSGAS